MMNNTENVNVKISEEVQKSIDNYKNQATSWGLEVKRLEMLKAQTEVTLSSLQSAIADKNAQISNLDIRITDLKVKVEDLTKKKEEMEKHILEKTKELNEREKDIEKRTSEIARKEGDFRKEEIVFAKKEANGRENMKILNDEKEEIRIKKSLIAELINKL